MAESAPGIISPLAPLNEFYRCPDSLLAPSFSAALSAAPGFFRLGQGTMCYGKRLPAHADGGGRGVIHDVAGQITVEGGTVGLPFDPAEVLENFRRERYAVNGYAGRRQVFSGHRARRAYYCVRPLLPLPLRKRVQRFVLADWPALRFPSWPVDTSVEQILERLLAVSMKAKGIDAVPFIWFWPDGAPSCIMLTHDVETGGGLAFMPRLMDIDDSFGFKASFQMIPRKQYAIPRSLPALVRARGYEWNLQDLDHQANLFEDREEFLRSAASINGHLKDYGAAGFRAGRLYRNADWLQALEIAYDMSVPNVGHLEAQRGGCCTVFPFFLGDVLELPLTTIQDYSLFHILGEYSIGLWKRQLALINRRHGLASFIVHPDYIREPRALEVYTA
ncbi:MAG: hypothetical protein LC130_16835, partial [Bryobacterales bacterium]|nr:hypothetical protein [Bryobacterales bacterium]